MPVLFALIPLYILIPWFFPPESRHTPALALDHAIPLMPAWTVVYGGLYFFLILLPVLLVRAQGLVRRTVHAYLLVWISSYLIFFFLYPTVALRPERVDGVGFGAWSLQALYSADPPYNCFPSIHVAHSCVSALASYRVHAPIGVFAGVLALLVAVSTLLIKQHYVLDVVAGGSLAWLAHVLFLRRYPSDRVPECDRQAAPALAAAAGCIALAAVSMAWLVYVWSEPSRLTGAN